MSYEKPVDLKNHPLEENIDTSKLTHVVDIPNAEQFEKIISSRQSGDVPASLNPQDAAKYRNQEALLAKGSVAFSIEQAFATLPRSVNANGQLMVSGSKVASGVVSWPGDTNVPRHWPQRHPSEAAVVKHMQATVTETDSGLVVHATETSDEKDLLHDSVNPSHVQKNYELMYDSTLGKLYLPEQQSVDGASEQSYLDGCDRVLRQLINNDSNAAQ